MSKAFDAYHTEVQAVADRMVEDGECSPWEAMVRAASIVERSRREKASKRKKETP